MNVVWVLTEIQVAKF